MDCERCGLGNHPVPDDGGDYTILVTGEAPGAEESKLSRPFVGKSGQLLRDALNELGYPVDKTTFTNIVKCRPPDNKIQRSYVECCYTSLPIQDNTKLVVLLGNTPLQAVLGEHGITNWNGVVKEIDGILYLAAYHPAYVLRDERHMADWLQALDNGLQAYQHGVKEPPKYTLVYPMSIPDIERMCVTLLNSPVISIDTEVASLDPFAKGNRLLVVSFATGDTAWAVAIDHPDDMCPLSQEGQDMIANTIEVHPYVIAHNAKFDQNQLKVLLGVDFVPKGDTMLASFLADTRKGIHGLKRLAATHLAMADYDAEVVAYAQEHRDADPDRGGSYAAMPLNLLLPYSAKDAAATYQLHPLLVGRLTEKQLALYHELMLPTSNALAHVQLNGMTVDPYIAQRYSLIYGQVIQGELESICQDKFVNAFTQRKRTKEPDFEFNPASWQQKAIVLYGTQACTWIKKDTDRHEHYLGNYYKLEPQGKTPKGDPSTDSNYLKSYKDICPLVAHLIRYEMLRKMLGTYIEPIATGRNLSGDGKVRSNFNQHIVETGRISSSAIAKNLGINQQNIPAPDREPGTLLQYLPIRNMFTHSFAGGCLLSADYSGMEVRVFASLSRCQPMIDILTSDRDFHTMVAARVLHKDYDSVSKQNRYNAKSVTFAMLYGGTEYTLWKNFGIPMDDGREMIAEYYRAFPEILTYTEESRAFAEEHGYIETPFGLRRPLPEIHSDEQAKREAAKREAVNTPTQGGAGMIALMALVFIDQAMQGNFKSMLINTVHDNTLTDVHPDDSMSFLVNTQREAMEGIVEWMGKAAPNIDMSWLIVPLVADFEIGSHYGALKPYNGKETE